MIETQKQSHLYQYLSPHHMNKMFSSSLGPWGKEAHSHPRLSPFPHHLFIIHLGGRISTAWDIRPITQSQHANSPGPPTFLLLSNRAQTHWEGHSA